MVSNGLEIRTTGEFSSCCITSKLFKKSDGNQYNIKNDSIQDVWNSQDRIEFIDNFENEFENYCKQCSIIEKNGGISKRLREINVWEYHYGKNNSKKLQILDLKMGNTCNLMCAICTPLNSSQWASFYRRNEWKEKIKAIHWQNDETFWHELNKISSGIRRIELSGGEPFLVKKQETLLKYLVKNNLAKNIDILWITNCTIWPQNLIKYFECFKTSRINVSLDNTGSQFEYIRYPAKWNDVQEIFRKFQKLSAENKIILTISYSIGFLNAFYLPEFHHWCRENKVDVYNNLVTYPVSAKDLPKEIKYQIMDKLASSMDPAYQQNPIIGANNWFTDFMMQEGNYERVKEYHDKIIKETRPQGLFEKAFPELVKYMK